MNFDEKKNETYNRCSNCNNEVHLGKDLFIAEKGVLGHRGPIPLGEVRFFCSETCLSNYFNDIPAESLPKFPPRIP